MNDSGHKRLAWLVALLTAWYVVWNGYVFSRRVPLLSTFFKSLGADVPFATRVVLRVCTPTVIWPFVVVAVLFVLVKEIVFESLLTRLLLSVSVFMITACLSAVVTEVIYQPLLQLIEHVG